MRRNLEPLERMIDQESMLNSSRITSTIFATGPVWEIRLPISVAKPRRAGEYVIDYLC
jgi:hypothetical protein